jgi:hypothetical protein
MTEAPTPSDLRLREKGMDKFAQRCFNTLACDREISGVQVASTLLQLPTFYTVNSNFISINLWWLRWHIRSIVGFRATEREGNSLPTEEEPCRYEAGEKTPVTLFDNYRCRGPLLASLSLYEYCSTNTACSYKPVTSGTRTSMILPLTPPTPGMERWSSIWLADIRTWPRSPLLAN